MASVGWGGSVTFWDRKNDMLKVLSIAGPSAGLPRGMIRVLTGTVMSIISSEIKQVLI